MTKDALAARGMVFDSAEPISSTVYVGPKVMALVAGLPHGARVLDIGCGSGYWASLFARRGCYAVGIDPSESGIEQARRAHPGVRFERAEVSPALLAELGEDPFDLVISTEVVEHVYDPAAWAAGSYAVLKFGGRLVLSTPYHGWLKNVVVAATGKYDFHHDALRTGGHIKFFSNDQLAVLLTTAGFHGLQFVGAGRVPFLWKSVVVSGAR